MVKKTANPIDVHVGGRVRLRRMLVGMSQDKLGDALGLTFQQVQKYEKGANRIGASRLYQISKILNVPVQFFFEDMPGAAQPEGAEGGFDEADTTPAFMEFVNSSEGLQLNRYFVAIDDPVVRRRILDLIKVLANDPTADSAMAMKDALTG